MRFYPLAIAVLAAISAAGCQDVVPTKTTYNPHPIHKIASLSPGASEIASLYLYSARLVGRTASDDYPQSVQSVPVIMSGTKPNIEDILDSGAEGILYDPATTNPADLGKLKDHGIELIPVGGDTVTDFEHSVYGAASATGDETNVNDYIQTEIEAKISAAKVTNSPTVAFLMPGQGSEHMIDGTNSFLGDMLKRIGAKPVGPDTKHFVTLNVEELIKDNPDVIMVASKSAADPRQIANDPRLAGLKAVKSKHVYGVSQDIALREGARVPDLAKAIGEILSMAAKS